MSKQISGHTGLLCLLGSPVAHSISPAMHNKACELLDLDYAYLAFDVKEEEMADAIKALKLMNAKGWNVTMPGKNIMVELADEVSLASEISGSANTVVNENGKLYATTTDGIGFMEAVKENDFDLSQKTMTLMGAGGAATAILVQAALSGLKEIHVFNVKDGFYQRALEIVEKLNKKTDCKVSLNDFTDPEILKEAIKKSDILVNGTSVGMAPNEGISLINDPSLFRKDLFVFDVIYNPKETKLLRDARETGCKTANGLTMLLHQGAASFKLWTGKDFPVEEVRRLYFPDSVKSV